MAAPMGSVGLKLRRRAASWRDRGAAPENRATWELHNVVKSMKAVFSRGYRQSQRQNRLSAHAGYGSLLTCGDGQASGPGNLVCADQRLRR